MGFYTNLSSIKTCSHCSSRLVMHVLTAEDHEHFRKTAPAIICPRCDAPSPARPLGTDPS